MGSLEIGEAIEGSHMKIRRVDLSNLLYRFVMDGDAPSVSSYKVG